MKAILSGQSAIAVCIEDSKFYSISLDEETWAERNECDIPFLFANAADIFQIEYTSRSEVLKKLETAWEQDRCLQLTLITLDKEENETTRIEAIECLNGLLSKAEVKEYVENRLYSAPMPTGSDLDGAIKLSKLESLEITTNFLLTIQNDQEEILKRYNVWNDLPYKIFGETLNNKRDFYYEAIRYGAFRLFVTERNKKDLAILQLLSHPRFRGISKARNIFQMWAAPFKEAATNIEFEKPKYEDSVSDTDDICKSTVNNYDAFQRAKKQIEAIKKCLIEGNKDKAFVFTSKLIESQRRDSKPEHIAKSLCQLAQFAKDEIGNPQIQSEFANMAVKENPDDSWTYATLGDAYRLLAEYQESLKMYHEAGVKSYDRENTVVALNGRAEVLKDLGQIEDALKIYEQCIKEYQGDIITRNARASALAYSGKLEEALKAYDEILQESNNIDTDKVTNSGRAQVLRDMGRADEALLVINNLCSVYPDDLVLQQNSAEILRELGKIEDAEKVLSNLTKRFPSAFNVMASHARMLRDLGRFTEAIEKYKNNIKSSPLSPWSYFGIAETYRKMGKLPTALKAYEEFISKFPYSGLSRNGKASVLVAMGEYSKALDILPKNPPASQGEWVAYHIKGMALMRKGELIEAENIFNWGFSECPWVSQREYFKTALASLRIRQGQYKEAVVLARQIVDPSIQPIANILIMHASGELGDMSLFNQSNKSIMNTAVPDNIIELKDALVKRYTQQAALTIPNDWLFNHECDSLLQAA